MTYYVECDACEEAKRKHVLGCDCYGEMIAVAGPWAYTWGEYWRGELGRIHAANPGKPAHLVCQRTGITFAGFVPVETTAVNSGASR